MEEEVEPRKRRKKQLLVESYVDLEAQRQTSRVEEKAIRVEEMEDGEEEVKMLKETLLEAEKYQKGEDFHQVSNHNGGFQTLPFIIANEAFGKVASCGLTSNMILYLTRGYGMKVASGTNILFLWSAATNFMPVVGAVLSDSFFGRFWTIGIGSISSLLGMIILWLTTMIPQARPPPCNEPSFACVSPTISQLITLCFSLVLMSIGTGGVKSASVVFGADQLDRRDSHRNKRALENFFSLYYVAGTVSVIIALTCIVYVQDQLGWKLGFGIPVVLMFLSTFSFFLASPFYVKLKANSSVLTTFGRVLVVYYKNRHLQLPSEDADELCNYNFGSSLSMPSKKFRYLNKACLNLKSPAILELNKPALSDQLPRIFCTVEQVEELKALMKVVPIWSAGIMISVNIGQNSFFLIQANSMDRHITSNFEIPAASFAIFTNLSVIVSLLLYNCLIIPLATKIRGRQAYLGTKQRMGIGLLVSCLSMIFSAIIETVRRKTAIQQGFSDSPQSIMSMSAMWIIPSYCLNGVAEAFNAVAQNEFYYSEFPKNMSTIAVSLLGVGISTGNVLASLILNIVDKASKIGGKESWVSSNMNKGHFDYYFWVLACLSVANFGYFVLCCRAYGPAAGQGIERIRKGEEQCLA